MHVDLALRPGRREVKLAQPTDELVVEEEGKSPIAWQGAQLSRAIKDFLDRRL